MVNSTNTQTAPQTDNADALRQQMQLFYNTSVTANSVPSVTVDYNSWCVANGFTQMLNTNVIKPCMEQGKVPMFVFDDAVNKIGIVAPKPKTADLVSSGLPVSCMYNAVKDTAVVNLLGLRGWFNNQITLMEEVATTQWFVNGFKSEFKPTAMLNKMLFTDYLLRSAICYVEIFRGTSVEKFYATRNVNLLMQLSEYKLPIVENGNATGQYKSFININKDLSIPLVRKQFENYLALNNENVTHTSVSYLKLNAPTKKTQTYNVVMPRGALQQIDAKMQYRIMPVYFVRNTGAMLKALLQHNLVELTYVKDSLQLRKIVTTANYKILQSLLDDKDKVNKVMESISFDDKTRGYLKLPDVTLLYSDNCIRAVGLRLCTIKVLDFNTYNNQYKGVDLQIVPEVFRTYVGRYKDNKQALLELYYSKEINSRRDWFMQKREELKYYSDCAKLQDTYCTAYNAMVQKVQAEVQQLNAQILQATKKNISIKECSDIYSELLSWLNYSTSKFSTAFLQNLHMMMTENKRLFPDYADVLKALTGTVKVTEHETSVEDTGLHGIAKKFLNLGDA